MPEFIKVATTDEVESHSGKLVEVKGKEIALFNVEGTYFALDNTCTHKGGPLSDGVVANDEVTCPWHGAKFKLTTGEVCNPPAATRVNAYKIRVDGSHIEIEL